MSVDIKCENNYIIINNDTKNKILIDGTNGLYDIFFKKFINEQNVIPDNFEKLNISINRGDSIKDGTNAAILDQLSLFDGGDFNFNGEDVKRLSKLVTNIGKQNKMILTQEFSRDKKGDDTVKKHYQGLNFDIGYDVGITLTDFLQDNQFEIIETFGKYIDPSTTRSSNKAFPPKNQKLSMDSEIFNKIGYKNCLITNATNVGSDQYDYEIVIGGKSLNNKKINRKNDQNVQTIFVGNQKKKGIIDTDTKKAAIIGKSLGDKLQVFLMFIRKMYIKSDRIKCIVTLDSIVFLFCIILDLPCFFTDTDRNKEGIKINEILYFNSDNLNPIIAKKRFENEKTIVLQGYTDSQKIIRELINKPDQERFIYISGDDKKTYIFSKQFYEGINKDLQEIINEIKKETVNGTNINQINEQTENIKRKTMKNVIMKKTNGNYVLLQSASKYNNFITRENNSPHNKSNLFYSLIINNEKRSALKQKYSATSFFYIAKTFAVFPQKGGNKKQNLYGGMNGEDKTDDEIIELFYTDPIWIYIKQDECDLPCPDKFDANKNLYLEIKDIYNTIFKDKSISLIDIYSELLCIFKYEPDYTSEKIEKSIQLLNGEKEYTKTLELLLEEELLLEKELLLFSNIPVKENSIVKKLNRDTRRVAKLIHNNKSRKSLLNSLRNTISSSLKQNTSMNIPSQLSRSEKLRSQRILHSRSYSNIKRKKTKKTKKNSENNMNVD